MNSLIFPLTSSNPLGQCPPIWLLHIPIYQVTVIFIHARYVPKDRWKCAVMPRGLGTASQKAGICCNCKISQKYDVLPLRIFQNLYSSPSFDFVII